MTYLLEDDGLDQYVARQDRIQVREGGSAGLLQVPRGGSGCGDRSKTHVEMDETEAEEGGADRRQGKEAEGMHEGVWAVEANDRKQQRL